MNKEIERQVVKHGEQLKVIFGLSRDLDGVKLCQRLHRLELKGNRLATDYCNGIVDSDKYDELSEPMLKKVNKILNNNNIPVFMNADARGYAFKIPSEYVAEHNLNIHQDMGGFGIIAPTFEK